MDLRVYLFWNLDVQSFPSWASISLYFHNFACLSFVCYHLRYYFSDNFSRLPFFQKFLLVHGYIVIGNLHNQFIIACTGITLVA